MTKPIISFYDSQKEAYEVVQDLIDHGVQREDISLVMPHSDHRADDRTAPVDTVSKQEHEDAGPMAVGAALGGLGGLLVSATMLAIPGVGPFIAAGPLATTIAGTTVGAYAGTIASGLRHHGVSEDRAHHYADRVHQGEIMVVVKSSEALHAQIETILARHHISASS